MTHPRLVTAIMGITLTAAAALGGDASPSTAPAPAPAEGLQTVRDSISAIRQELAAAKLQLQTLQRELKDLRDFQASPDPAADQKKWQAQIDAIEEQRKQLALERKRLDAARQSLRDATKGK